MRLCWVLFVILTQTRVRKEGGTSAEDFPQSDWPKCMWQGAFFLLLIHMGGSSSLWVVPSMGTCFQVIYESKLSKP